MTTSKSMTLAMSGCAVAVILPSALAAYLAPGTWTTVAAAGAAAATSGFMAAGLRAVRELTVATGREQQLRTAEAANTDRIAALEARVRETASQDDVTGALNRRTFFTRLDEAIRRDARLRKPMAFLLVDIEGFRKINTHAGRMVGDRVLRLVGRALQASTRGTDFVGRIGGDEFAVVLGECSDPRPAIDRIFVALHGETADPEHALPVQVSVGAVTIDGNHHGAVDPVMLFRIGEDALASVRGSGKCRSGKREYPVEDALPAPVALSRG